MEKYLERHKQPNLTEETENLNKQVKKKIWVSFFKTLLKDPKKSPKKGNAKECSNYRTIALISHARKGMLKTLQARLQQYVNHELPDVQAGFRKGRGTKDQTANIS